MPKLLILQPADGSKPTKTIKKDGTKISFDQRQKLWKFHWIEYNNFHSIIEELILSDHSTFVLGEPTEWALENIESVLQRTKRPKPEWPNPTIKPDRDGEQLVLDLDDVYWPMFDAQNPEPAIKAYLKENGIDCDVTWQITSGQKVGSREARVRLYMVGERDYPLDYRKAWCLQCGADSAVYTANQVIYTAAPIYEDGKDEIKRRVGFIEGKHRKLKLPLVEMKEVEKVIRENTYSAEHFETDELPPEVKSGKVFRRYFMPKAFSLLNKGLTHNQVFTIIQAEASQVEGREFHAENTHDYIRDAEAKIAEERKVKRLEQEQALANSDRRAEPTAHGQIIPDDALFPKDTLIEALGYAMYQSSHRPNKLISAMGARAIIAFLAGGKYKSVENDRMNIQQVVTARTGVGKNVAVNTLAEQIYTLFGFDEEDLIHEVVLKVVRDTNSTIQGIIDHAGIGNKHDLLFNIDEYGTFVKQATAKNASVHKMTLHDMFLELYSSANGVYMPRHLSGNNDKRKPLQAPCFVLNGATTQSTLVEAIDSDDITSGKMGRICMFDADVFAEGPARPEPFHLDDEWREFMLKLTKNNLLEANMIIKSDDLVAQARVNTPISIDFDEGVSDYFFKLSKKYYKLRESQVHGELWARAVENIKKYSCIEAVATDFMNPVVSMEIAKRNTSLVEHSCKYAVDMFVSEVADNQYDGAERAIIDRLYAEGESNWLHQKILKELGKVRKLGGPRQRQDILDGLEADGVIISQKLHNARGKPTVSYRLTDMYFMVETKRKERLK